jgi:hypothetical protein
LAALSVMVSVAVRVPPAVGLNVTVTLQVLVGATVAPEQLSAVLAKSPAFAPPSVAVEMARFAAPVLVKVTCCPLDDAFTITEPKAWLTSDRLTAGIATNTPKGDKELTIAVIRGGL